MKLRPALPGAAGALELTSTGGAIGRVEGRVSKDGEKSFTVTFAVVVTALLAAVDTVGAINLWRSKDQGWFA